MAGKMRVPKQIFARVQKNSDGTEYVDAHETSEPFDEEGAVGRYELVEKGKITIEHSFVKEARGPEIDIDDRRRRTSERRA
jgi:hypothetical protein